MGKDAGKTPDEYDDVNNPDPRKFRGGHRKKTTGGSEQKHPTSSHKNTTMAACKKTGKRTHVKKTTASKKLVSEYQEEYDDINNPDPNAHKAKHQKALRARAKKELENNKISTIRR